MKTAARQVDSEHRPGPPLLTVKELAERWGVSTGSIYAWSNPTYPDPIPRIKINGIVRFVAADVETWLRRKQEKGIIR